MRDELRLPWAEDEPSLDGRRLARMGRHRNQARWHGDGRHWATPPEIFEPLNAEFAFELDPCATPATAKCARYFTESDDGLAQVWAPARVFMNPPYGREIPAWTAKAVAERSAGALVVGLLPAATDLEWWHRDVVAGGAELRWIRGRVRFLLDGRRWANAFTPSVVVIWRP